MLPNRWNSRAFQRSLGGWSPGTFFVASESCFDHQIDIDHDSIFHSHNRPHLFVQMGGRSQVCLCMIKTVVVLFTGVSGNAVQVLQVGAGAWSRLELQDSAHLQTQARHTSHLHRTQPLNKHSPLTVIISFSMQW